MKHARYRSRVAKVVKRRGGEVERDCEWIVRVRFDSSEKAQDAYFDLLLDKPESVDLVAVDGRLIVYFE